MQLFEESASSSGTSSGRRARYETASRKHHDHLIDVETGNVIEFVGDELESIQKRIVEKPGSASSIIGWSSTASPSTATAELDPPARIPIGARVALVLLFLACAPLHLAAKWKTGRSTRPPRFLAAAAWIVGA